MEISVESGERQSVVTVVGDMDVDTAYDVYIATVNELQDMPRDVVIDLAGVAFIDSTGLGMLVRSRTDVTAQPGSRLLLRAPSERVQQILNVTALTNEFDYA